jgi:hypothetical protein
MRVRLDTVILSLLSVVGVVVLGGAVAAGVTLLIVIAVAGLGVVAFANAVAALGQLLEAIDE